jgi:polyphosphate kinase
MRRMTPAPAPKDTAPRGPSRPAAAPDPLLDPSLYINRELSWLEFNWRVLAQAQDPCHPLLERVKFLAIVATNLDEFFMVRVATLQRQLRTGVDQVGPDGWTGKDLLRVVRESAIEMQNAQAACWADDVRPKLAEAGIRILEPAEYTDEIRAYLETHFTRQIRPVLTPLAFDPGHPFPFISNLSLNLAVVVNYEGQTRFARLKLPTVLPRFIPLPAAVAGGRETTFVWLEDVVRDHLGSLFPGTTIKGAYLFRVIRDADLVIQEDEAHDLLALIDEGLRHQRHGAIASLEVEQSMPKRVLETLTQNFETDESHVVRTRHRLGFGCWMELGGLPRTDLKYPSFPPMQMWPGQDLHQIFEDVRHRDRFVHIPYQSFNAIEAFVRAAAHDPQVVAIKMTLYRIGHDSPLVDLLVEAAEAGKQVAVLVELKARFDEENNIRWAHRLEAAGAHVVYGLPHLKTHAKLCLVVRKEADGIRQYVHVGTGNYNSATARVYVDLGLFTARAEIVEDAADLFNHLTGYADRREYRQLLVAPVTLRSRLLALIDREIAHAQAGQPARIAFKLNAITDHELIRAFYRASQAGVTVDLTVRGVCCLKPGVAGVSDRITVRSIVGRFLEHSRVYWFANAGTPHVFIGSADLMERNLDHRVEVLCPVVDTEIATHLHDVVIGMYQKDAHRARWLGSDGRYAPHAKATEPEALNAQDAFLAWYTQNV